MEVVVKRFADNGDTTMGILYIDGVFQCFTIEDEERAIKVKGETRVPNGKYNLGLRNSGGYNNRYRGKYPSIHKGMLCVYNEENWIIKTDDMSFQYILIHTGNTDEHTAGCLLLNDGVSKKFRGSSSVDAYKRIYPKIAAAVQASMEDENAEPVTIEYIDIEVGK